MASARWMKSEVPVWKVLSSYIIIHASDQLRLMSQTMTPTQICFTQHCIRAGSHSSASAPRPINQWQRLKHTPFLLEDERGSVLRWLHPTLRTSSLPAPNLFFLYICHYYEFTQKKKTTTNVLSKCGADINATFRMNSFFTVRLFFDISATIRSDLSNTDLVYGSDAHTGISSWALLWLVQSPLPEKRWLPGNQISFSKSASTKITAAENCCTSN